MKEPSSSEQLREGESESPGLIGAALAPGRRHAEEVLPAASLLPPLARTEGGGEETAATAAAASPFF